MSDIFSPRFASWKKYTSQVWKKYRTSKLYVFYERKKNKPFDPLILFTLFGESGNKNLVFWEVLNMNL